MFALLQPAMQCTQSTSLPKYRTKHDMHNMGAIAKITRKPCCRKETARCRKCSFPLKFANNIHYKY